MKMIHKRPLYLALVLVILVQLACDFLVAGKIECESRGGTWREETDVITGKTRGRCEMPPTQEAGADDPAPAPLEEGEAPPVAADGGAAGDCLATQDAYAWLYVDYDKDSDSGNWTCNARFIFSNTSAEPQILLVYIAWDNKTTQNSAWENHPVQPGSTWEQQVNRSSFTNGDYLYLDVVRMLVVRDVTECQGILPSENQSTWEAQAVTIDELTCP